MAFSLPKSSRWPAIANILILCCLFPFFVLAQNCSKDNPCATGCCSVSGYCGTTEEHCGAGNCVDTCDYKLECDADNPCAIGCCSKTGYCGLGPDYCGKDVCVSGCDSKAECDPGFGSEWAKNSKCPLNVCCSKYGFCGTTDEFCGNKKVKKPTCSLTNSTLDRVVGYYEGWSSRRACNGFWPEQIPTGVYTHINFAFAAIDPETFEVRPSETDDIELMQRVTNLKRADPDLKVMIALGGWTFNDLGATRTTFSDIAGSQDNQDKFFSSLTKFLSLYDLDGVDLDWEYPVADDRGGKEEDFKNFPDFLRRLKSALQGTGGRSELSITLPASYWYLQNFDIVNLVRHVDFFNIMSYDLHGTWDRGNKWTGEYLNAHTNLTEIDLALDLLWRNNIDSSKVVMGLAFYGRTYTVVDSGCVTPGCMYASGGNKGDCSAEVGILLNSEIDQIFDKFDLKPILYNDSAVETLTWSNQWLSYDDATTLKSKVDYARAACLGGVMVWAISHDTSDAKYSNALGQVSHRTRKTLPTMFFPSDYPVDDDPYISTQEDHLQCKWANCGDPCPTGWKMMTRDDPDKHHDNEIILDDTTCTSPHGRRFCCPPSETFPKCGWYGFNKGKCKSEKSCPDGRREVGSLTHGCKWGSYQGMCCTVEDDDGKVLNSMRLYEGCDWSNWSDCSNGKCTFAGSLWPTDFVDSSTGSGASMCDWDWKESNEAGNINGKVPDPQKRKYCCDTSDPLKSWGKCTWRDDVGDYGASGERCKSGCYSNEIPIAMDQWGDRCRQSGAKSYCCQGTYSVQSESLIPELAQWDSDLADWVENPTCDTDDNNLLKRGQVPLADVKISRVEDMLGDLLLGYEGGNDSNIFRKEEAIFDKHIAPKWKYLATEYSLEWLTSNETYPAGNFYSPQSLGRIVMCNADAFNAMIGGTDTELNCTSYTPTADDYYSADDSGDTIPTLDKRWIEERNVLRQLEKREGPKPKSFDCDGRSVKYQTPGYPSAGQWDVDSPQVRLAYDLVDWHLCHTTEIQTHNIGNLRGTYATEHLIELQTIELFSDFATSEDAPEECEAIDCDFMVDFFSKPVLDDPPPMDGLADSQQKIPIQRMMESLGSSWNAENFVILQSSINLNKAQIWRNGGARSLKKFKNEIVQNPTEALEIVRDTVAVYNYLRNGAVWQKFKAINEKVREEMKRAQDQYKLNTVKDNRLQECWDAFMEQHMENFVANGQSWIKSAIKLVGDHWVPSNFDNPDDPFITQVCQSIQEVLSLLESAAARYVQSFDLGLADDSMNTS